MGLAAGRRRSGGAAVPVLALPKLDQSVDRWRDALRRIEDLGFSTVSVSDHFTQGWVMEPTVAMTSAAEATSRLRVLSAVLATTTGIR